MPAARSAPPPRALILAAGIGKRLGTRDGRPKCLLEFDGRTLLDRHLAILHGACVTDVTLVVGHGAEQVRAAAAGRAATILNPDYREGSIVSLWAARDLLRGGTPILLMDADVLYDPRLMQRLLAAPSADIVLVDRELEPGDEPVKLCLSDGRIVDFHKRPSAPHDWHGESVGFFALCPATAAALADRASAYVAAGQRALEYEVPLRDLMCDGADRFTAIDVTGLPWTEIDFPADVAKAAALLPELTA